MWSIHSIRGVYALYVEYTLYTWSIRSIPYLPYNNSLFTFSAIKIAVHHTYSYSAITVTFNKNNCGSYQ